MNVSRFLLVLLRFLGHIGGYVREQLGSIHTTDMGTQSIEADNEEEGKAAVLVDNGAIFWEEPLNALTKLAHVARGKNHSFGGEVIILVDFLESGLQGLTRATPVGIAVHKHKLTFRRLNELSEMLRASYSHHVLQHILGTTLGHI
jgi:hypothetical protein